MKITKLAEVLNIHFNQALLLPPFLGLTSLCLERLPENLVAPRVEVDSRNIGLLTH